MHPTLRTAPCLKRIKTKRDQSGIAGVSAQAIQASCPPDDGPPPEQQQQPAVHWQRSAPTGLLGAQSSFDADKVLMQPPLHHFSTEQQVHALCQPPDGVRLREAPVRPITSVLSHRNPLCRRHPRRSGPAAMSSPGQIRRRRVRAQPRQGYPLSRREPRRVSARIRTSIGGGFVTLLYLTNCLVISGTENLGLVI